MRLISLLVVTMLIVRTIGNIFFFSPYNSKGICGQISTTHFKLYNLVVTGSCCLPIPVLLVIHQVQCIIQISVIKFINSGFLTNLININLLHSCCYWQYFNLIIKLQF